MEATVSRILQMVLGLWTRGYVPLVMASLLTLTSSLSFEAWLSATRLTNEQRQRSWMSLLQVQNEPNRDETRQVLVAAAVQSSFVEADPGCGEPNGGGHSPNSTHWICEQGARIARRFRDLEGAYRASRSKPCESSSWACAQVSLLDRLDLRYGNEVKCRDRISLAAARARAAFALDPAPAQIIANCPDLDSPYDSPICEHEGEHSALFYSPNYAPPITHGSVAFSRIVEPLMALAESSSAEETTHRVTSIYFVTPSGLVRTTGSRTAPRDGAVNDEGVASRHYYARSIFSPLRDRAYLKALLRQASNRQLSPESRYWSRPYLDYAGAGLIVTHCIPTFGELSPGSMSVDENPADDPFSGALCVDFNLKVDTITDDPPSPLFREAIYSADGSRVSAVDEFPEYSVAIDEFFSGGPSPSRSVVARLGDTELYAVPVGDDRWLLFTPRPTGSHRTSIAFILNVLLLVSFVMISAGVRIRRTRRSGEAAMLRNLQVGVVEFVDSAIVRGNDRAEEILGRVLLTFDEEHGLGSAAPVEFDEVVDLESIVGITDVLKDRIRDNPGLPKISIVRLLREEGIASGYYARLKFHPANAHSTWIEVYGSPFLSRSPGSSGSTTFSMIRRTSPRTADELDKKYPEKE